MLALIIKIAMCYNGLSIGTIAANDGIKTASSTSSYPGTSLEVFTHIIEYVENGQAISTDEPRGTTLSHTTLLEEEWTTISVTQHDTDVHQFPEIIEPTSSGDWAWYPLDWAWDMVLRVISGIVGIFGNLLVIVVLVHRGSKSRSMDILITGLSVADLLTSIFIFPIPYATSVPSTWLGEFYCRVIYTSCPMWTSITASAYILMAISIDRYLAVVFPLRFNRLVTRRRVSIVILVIWVMAVASGSFGFVIYAVDENTHTCQESYSSYQEQIAITYYWFALRLVIPCVVMFVTQALIVRELNTQAVLFLDVTNLSKGGASAATGGEVMPSFHIVARNRVVKLMLVVILIYAICWTPNQVAYLGYNLGWVPVSYLNSPLHHLLTVLGFYNSCANPVIYAVRYPKFRAAVRDLFTCASSRNTPLFEKDDGSAKSFVSRSV